MEARDMLLSLHVTASALGLALGALAIRAERWPPHRSRAGAWYHWSVLAVSFTAVLLAALNWAALWWLSVLAVVSYGLALIGLLAARRRPPGWLRAYAHGQGGSYIALVTAFLVVSLDGFASTLAWLLPTLLGVPLIEWRVRQLGSLPDRVQA